MGNQHVKAKRYSPVSNFRIFIVIIIILLYYKTENNLLLIENKERT